MMMLRGFWKVRAGVTGAFVFALIVGSTATAGTIYSWTTEDGDVSFTDDAKNVPERYRDQVRTRTSSSIANYERTTVQDAKGGERYRKQLAERVLYLRAVNEAAPQYGYAPSGRGQATLEVGGVTLDLSSNDDAEPIIVESLRVRRADQIASRHDTVVTQGDRTLAIVRGNQSGEVGGVSNVLDEDDVELYR